MSEKPSTGSDQRQHFRCVRPDPLAREKIDSRNPRKGKAPIHTACVLYVKLIIPPVYIHKNHDALYLATHIIIHHSSEVVTNAFPVASMAYQVILEPGIWSVS